MGSGLRVGGQWIERGSMGRGLRKGGQWIERGWAVD